MSKLVCSKCGGTLFTKTGMGLVYTVYVPNGSPPYSNDYRCSNCGNIETVRYPAVYYDAPKPAEVELPEKSKVHEEMKVEESVVSTPITTTSGYVKVGESESLPLDNYCYKCDSITSDSENPIQANHYEFSCKIGDTPYLNTSVSKTIMDSDYNQYIKCPICDEYIKIPLTHCSDESSVKICEKCKKAIADLKIMLKEKKGE